MNLVTDLITLAATFALCVSGCLALAMSQPRNRRRVFGHGARLVPPRWLRPAGWVSLMIGLVACIVRDGISFGTVLWPLMIAFAALAVAVALAFWPDKMHLPCV